MNRMRAAVAAAAAAGTLLVTASVVSADNVPTDLRARLDGAAEVRMELALARDNVESVICFILDGDGIDPGDSLAGAIRAGRAGSGGAAVIDLGKNILWLEGEGEGCAPAPDATVADAVFRRPADYYVELRVISSPGDGRIPEQPIVGQLEAD